MVVGKKVVKKATREHSVIRTHASCETSTSWLLPYVRGSLVLKLARWTAPPYALILIVLHHLEMTEISNINSLEKECENFGYKVTR